MVSRPENTEMNELSTRLFVLDAVFCTFNVAYGNVSVKEFDPVDSLEIIVSVINGRVRSKPNLSSSILNEVKVGTRPPKLEEAGGWYMIELEPDIQSHLQVLNE